jgi:hypothetical protein
LHGRAPERVVIPGAGRVKNAILAGMAGMTLVVCRADHYVYNEWFYKTAVLQNSPWMTSKEERK